MEIEKKALGLFEQMQYDIKVLQEKVKLLENKHIKDAFDIRHFSEATKIVGCCRQTLKKAINNQVLKNGQDYRTNGTRYTFSLSSLKKLKGKI